MKIDHNNVYEYTKDNGTIYYANFNGVMLGTVFSRAHNKTERDDYLIIGTSMAIPINEHPNNNTQFSQSGYFTTREEATEYFRFLLVAYLQKVNHWELKDNPIPMDDLDNFVGFVEDGRYIERIDQEIWKQAVQDYKTKMSIIVPKK